MPTRGRGNDETGSGRGADRVEVTLPDGYNYVGTVIREYRDAYGPALLVRDSLGEERIARPDRPEVTVEYLDGDDGGGRR